ncbi:MAG TPA: hypothetical protein VN776_08890 [Terracidiphilus sp.]|nr:hypothetical protein [Terracidiphilus sp.]
MRQLLLVVAGVAALSAVYPAAPAGADARGRELIATLHLKVLPGESGYLGLIGDSAQKVEVDGRALRVQSQVYYMLTRDRPVNYRTGWLPMIRMF